MRFISLLLTLALAACAHGNRPVSAEPSALVESLKEERDAWLRDLAAKADKNTGWLSLLDCDGTLWEGEAVAAGHPGRIDLAEWAAGEIHRRPKVDGQADCYPAESASSVSHDMLLGYVLGNFYLKDLSAFERLEKYTEDNYAVMGVPKDLTVWSPTGVGLLGRATAFLGGATKSYGNVEDPCTPVFDDYEYHLQTLAILLDGEIAGGISDLCLTALKRNAEKFPADALIVGAYAAYAGNVDDAAKLLLAKNYECPSYVRPVDAYCTVHKAYVASVLLKRYGEK